MRDLPNLVVGPISDIEIAVGVGRDAGRDVELGVVESLAIAGTIPSVACLVGTVAWCVWKGIIVPSNFSTCDYLGCDIDGYLIRTLKTYHRVSFGIT